MSVDKDASQKDIKKAYRNCKSPIPSEFGGENKMKLDGALFEKPFLPLF
ncbi:hypothetical protein [Maribacter sp. 2307ULW6-5]